jgi:predicted GNAT family acetyltransferase
MPIDFSLADNPFWSALQTSQQHFSVGTSQIRKYPADILPFVGLSSQHSSFLELITPHMNSGEEVYIKNGIGRIPPGWKIINHLSCIQMVCTHLSDIPLNKHFTVTRLGDMDFDELFQLVNLVQPGFIMERTHLLGDYFGIRIDGKLVATAGERLKMTGFIELSAVCTLPEFTGKGYAQVLIRQVCERIFKKGSIPILHVLDSNTRAIKLYELFNFKKRIDFPFLKLKWEG